MRGREEETKKGGLQPTLNLVTVKLGDSHLLKLTLPIETRDSSF